jgi:hypothetical protein
MSTLLERPAAGPYGAARAGAAVEEGRRFSWMVLAATAAVVLVRLPFVLSPALPDEGGFLTVARHWHAAGSSLYGGYWVDRPPLLIAIFHVATSLGGLTALRLIGCAAAAATVVATSSAAHQIGGRRAGAWCAVVTATLLVSPQLGAVEVDGELLAAPFIAGGVSFAIAGLRPGSPTRVRSAALATGACAAAALLVKQNMADVAVFALTGCLVSYVTRPGDRSRIRAVVGWATAGGLAVTGAVAALTVAHGTSLVGVFDAMYPFRVDAARAITASNNPAVADRLHSLLHSWGFSAVPLLMLAFAWQVVRGRLRGPVSWALVATMCFATASILVGEGYWSHYLVEIIPPVAVATGMLMVVQPRATRVLVAVVTPLAAVAWYQGLVAPTPAGATSIGSTISEVAGSSDTIVSGNPATVEASGLASPYPYLWSLPAQIFDRDTTLLDSVLTGPDAPTWLVSRNGSSILQLHGNRLAAAVRNHYHPVANVCGRTIYLHDGITRAVPRAPSRCAQSSALTSTLHMATHLLERVGA